MKYEFYTTVDQIKDKNHVWVFIADKSNMLTNATATIARKNYGRQMGDAAGLQDNGLGASYGVVMREQNRFTVVPLKELMDNLIALYASAMVDTERVYVLPDFIATTLHRHDATEVQRIVREVFLKCSDKSKFILPQAWKKLYKL